MIQTYKNLIRNHYRSGVSRDNRLTLEGAFLDIDQLYQGRYRYSGLPMSLHSLRVAMLLCQSGADIQTTIAGLLHDVLEDTHVTGREIQTAYGHWYADMSRALKKTDNIQLTHQKILHAGRHDLRSLLIKFCDRLDNMRELQWLPSHKRHRISRESLDFYLPLSHHIDIPGAMREEMKALATRFS